MVRAQSVTDTLVYTYNGDGLLVAQSENTNVARYTWDLAIGLPQLLSDGSALYLPDVGQWDGQQWSYYLLDALGSVRQLSGEQGYVVQQYEYAPFGEPLAAEGGRTSLLRYTGEMWDGNLGMVYLRARWYTPQVSRFVSPDTIAPNPRNPSSIRWAAPAIGQTVTGLWTYAGRQLPAQ